MDDTTPAPIDPIRAAYLDMEQRRKRANRVRNWVNPLLTLQQAQAGNAKHADEQPALDYPTDAA
ncbi:hypothetical protein E1292_35280 [Nonomuraea deserti]|uniref:Uncharacterized protein n=1 Tax=Nonomuraea deserti TaxID=1848322 RepID=A0A4R4V7Y8_9ACTN|nr:hypothetical protein [Nonomuraea deserti]TDC98502.1 hypothetical protein E1292_35280 [Nonomuraea deserti]